MLILNNMDKKAKNFTYQNLQKSKCFKCNFDLSKFDYASFRGAHMKSCSFNESSFKETEFIGANLKESSFRGCRFENVVFEGAKLEGVSFQGAEFINVYMVGTSLEGVKGLDLTKADIKFFETMPSLELSEELTQAILLLMENPFIAKARVLDTKDKTINPISVMRLLDNFSEEQLIGLAKPLSSAVTREFYTLSYLIKSLSKLVSEHGGEN